MVQRLVLLRFSMDFFKVESLSSRVYLDHGT